MGLAILILGLAIFIATHVFVSLRGERVKLWAFAHLLSNGDLGGIVLFGSILGWAVYDRISLKRRVDPGAPPIPMGGWKNDAVAVVVGTLIYLAVGFVFHPLAGVPVFGR